MSDRFSYSSESCEEGGTCHTCYKHIWHKGHDCSVEQEGASPQPPQSGCEYLRLIQEEGVVSESWRVVDVVALSVFDILVELRCEILKLFSSH